MSFFPLGNFDTSARIEQKIIAIASRLFDTLPKLPHGDITRIYLHWSVEAMGCKDAAYNVVVERYNNQYEMNVTHDPRDNARSTFQDECYAKHTAWRNYGAVGVALNGMDGATEQNFGPDSVTVAGLTYLCAATAAVACRYGIEIDGSSHDLDRPEYDGEWPVLTHAEAANLPGNPVHSGAYAYGPGPVGSLERWDLAAFTPGPVTAFTANLCGAALRTVARKYRAYL